MQITPHFAGMTRISALEARRLQEHPDPDVFIVAGTSYDGFFKCTNEEQARDADTMQAREGTYRNTLETLEKCGQKAGATGWAAIAAVNAEYDLAFDAILLAVRRGIEQVIQDGQETAARNGALTIEQATKLLNQARGNRDRMLHGLGLERRDMVKSIVARYDESLAGQLDTSDEAAGFRSWEREFRDSQIREFYEARALAPAT